MVVEGQFKNALDRLSDYCPSGDVLSAARCLVVAVEQLVKIEERRVVETRSDKTAIPPEAVPIQAFVDALVFRMAGFSEEDVAFVNRRMDQLQAK